MFLYMAMHLTGNLLVLTSWTHCFVNFTVKFAPVRKSHHAPQSTESCQAVYDKNTMKNIRAALNRHLSDIGKWNFFSILLLQLKAYILLMLQGEALILCREKPSSLLTAPSMDFLKTDGRGFIKAYTTQAYHQWWRFKVQSHYSVWHQRMIIRSYTQIYVRGSLSIRRVRSSYAGIRRWTLLYAEAKIIFWTCSKLFSVCERIDNTLLIRSSYARHTLDTLGIHWIR